MRCPICKREFDPATSKTLPFCSERCRTIDLGRWLGESYGVPAEPAEPPEESGEADQTAGGNGAPEE